MHKWSISAELIQQVYWLHLICTRSQMFEPWNRVTEKRNRWPKKKRAKIKCSEKYKVRGSIVLVWVGGEKSWMLYNSWSLGDTKIERSIIIWEVLENGWQILYHLNTWLVFLGGKKTSLVRVHTKEGTCFLPEYCGLAARDSNSKATS